MTEEEDKRISAELGVTPGRWAFLTRAGVAPTPPAGSVLIASTYSPMWIAGQHDKAMEAANARLMAKSKEMYALLKRAEAAIANVKKNTNWDDDPYGPDGGGLDGDIRALIAELKGGAK